MKMENGLTQEENSMEKKNVHVDEEDSNNYI